MAFNTLTITDKGVTLQAKVLGGATLTFTKAQSGSGTLPGGTDITAMTALVAPEQDIVIASVTPSVPNKLTARIDFTNDGLEAGYYWREIGLFADDPDDGEILYAYSNAGDEGTFIPAEGDGVTEQIVDLVTLIANVMSVTVEVDNSLAHPVWADLLINGVIPCTGTGTNTIAVNNANITEYVDGLKIALDMETTNTGAATVNINGMGAKGMALQPGSGLYMPLTGGETVGLSLWQYKAAGDVFVLLSGPGNPAFAKAVHSHTIANVTSLQAALDGKAASSHTHAIANVTGLQSALDGKASYGDATFAPEVFNTSGSPLTLDGTQIGVCQIVGKLVHAWGVMRVLSTEGLTGNARFRLPLPVSPSAVYGSGVGNYPLGQVLLRNIAYPSGAVQAAFQATTGTDYGYVIFTRSNSTTVLLQCEALSAEGATVTFDVWYRTP